MKKSLLFLPMLSLLLGGCIGKKTYEASEYMIPLPWEMTEDFKILQLSDIHFSQSDVFEEHFKVLDRTIKAADPNLIVLNGDCFTYADKHVVKKLFNFIDSYNIFWTYTFGNHDDQGYYPDTYIQRLLGNKTYGHSVFKNLEDDDVTGRSNFVLNLQDKATHQVKYQVFLLDSNNYNFQTVEYDYIKQDQINWYERIVNYSTTNFGGGSPIPSSMYMHIGVSEHTSIWDQSQDKDHQPDSIRVVLGDMEEWGGSPSSDLHFFKKITELGSTKTISVAHDHANDSVVEYEGVFLCHGVHSTNRIYNDKENVKFGGSVIKIDKTTLETSFKNFYVSYENENVTSQPEGEGWAK